MNSFEVIFFFSRKRYFLSSTDGDSALPKGTLHSQCSLKQVSFGNIYSLLISCLRSLLSPYEARAVLGRLAVSSGRDHSF